MATDPGVAESDMTVTKQKTTKIICRYILEILQETTAVKLVFQKIKSHNWLVSQYMYKLCLYIVY